MNIKPITFTKAEIELVNSNSKAAMVFRTKFTTPAIQLPRAKEKGGWLNEEVRFSYCITLVADSRELLLSNFMKVSEQDLFVGTFGLFYEITVKDVSIYQAKFFPNVYHSRLEGLDHFQTIEEIDKLLD